MPWTTRVYYGDETIVGTPVKKEKAARRPYRRYQIRTANQKHKIEENILEKSVKIRTNFYFGKF